MSNAHHQISNQKLDSESEEKSSLEELLRPIRVNKEELDGEWDACVLIVIFRRRVDGELSVLLTQRSRSLSTHAGEVAFPGSDVGRELIIGWWRGKEGGWVRSI